MYQCNTNNHASFHLWWKENLLNHQRVSKYHQHDCLKSFLSLIISLITALIVKHSHTFAGTYTFYLCEKSILDQTWNILNTKFGSQWKDRERSYRERQILAYFCKLVARILVFKTVLKVLELWKLSNKLNLKRSGAS